MTDSAIPSLVEYVASRLPFMTECCCRVLSRLGTKPSRAGIVRSPLFLASALLWIFFGHGTSVSMIADDGPQERVAPGTPTTTLPKPGTGASDTAQQQREAAAQGD